MTVPLLLDVDGVLNAFPGDAKGDSWSDWHMERCMGYKIWHSREMARELRALDVEVHWLTTWRHEANKWIAPLFGWDELPVLTDMEEGTGFTRSRMVNDVHWWKLDLAMEFLKANPGPLIWVDDDLAFDAEATDWCEENDVLAVGCNTNTGITRADITDMKNYILRRSHDGNAAAS